MSTSRAMSRLLRASSRPLPRSSCSSLSSSLHPASSLRPTTSLSFPSASLSAARRSFFSRTATSADSQQQQASSTASNEQSSASTTSSTANNNSNTQQAQQPASPSSSSSASTAQQPQQQQADSSSNNGTQQQQQQQLAQLQQQLTTAQQQQKDTYDRLLRTAAEMENLRRTTRIDVDNARKYATTGFAKAVLEVADTLELAGKSAREALAGGALTDGEKAREVVQSLLEGVEMTERVLGKALQDNGVSKVDAMGVKFNPHEHHGLFEVEGEPGQEAGTIAHVMKQGYKIHDRILRAAQVGTVKAKKA